MRNANVISAYFFAYIHDQQGWFTSHCCIHDASPGISCSQALWAQEGLSCAQQAAYHAGIGNPFW